MLLGLALALAACGGGEADPDSFGGGGGDSAGNQSSGGDNAGDDSSGASEEANPGNPDAFRLAPAGWENSCTVLSNDEVADATGFTVLEAREANGCNWVIETVDENVLGEPTIGWMPMTPRQVQIQRETAPLVSSDIVVEPIDGLGVEAFWQGTTVNDLGEVWVRTDQIGYRVVNQFASFDYEDDTQVIMQSLAAAIDAALQDIDVLAASGDAASALIPPDRVALPEGIPTVDGLIPELAAIPVPDGAVFGTGGVYPDRASQDIYLDTSVGDTARFYLEALPAAGFEITSSGTVQSEDEVLEFASMSISFLDPNGNNGDLNIREGAFAPTQMGVQIFGVG